MHSAREALRLDLEGEEAQAWPLLIDHRLYRQAYLVARYLRKYEDISATYYADQEFLKKRYLQAAELYIGSVRTLEEVMLQYMAV